MRFLKKVWPALLLLLAPGARAQFIGTVQIQTVQAQLANNTTCTGNVQNFLTSAAIPNFFNLGQTVHQVSALSSATSFTIEIDGIDVLGNAIRISNNPVSFANGTPTQYIAQGNGYYPNIQVSVTCSAGALFTLTYTGSSGGQTAVVGAPAGNVVNVNGGITNQVQGISPSGNNGFTVNPVVEGAVQPATNSGTAAIGVDNTSTGLLSYGNAANATLSFGSAPSPSTATETAFGFYGNLQGGGGTTGPNAPWACVTAFGSCSSTGLAFYPNVNASKPLQFNLGNSSTATTETVFVNMAGRPTIRQGAQGSGTSPPFSSNTLAGSTVLAMISVNCAQPCTPGVTSVTDTQGNLYKLVASNTQGVNPGLNRQEGVFFFVAGPTTAAADTLTFTTAGGTGIETAGMVELSGIVPAPLFQAIVIPLADSLGRQAVAQDALGANLFSCTVTLSTNTTTQCTNLPPSSAVRAYITDFQINTTTAGSATTIQLVTGTGANCVTGNANLSAIAYPNTTVGIQSILGVRTPLAAPAGAAVCAKQAGTTAGTSVVELRGFFAP